MTDDEIVERVRAYATAHELPPPAPSQAVAEVEAVVGYPMPKLLRRLYLEVANGGFGPDGSILSLVDAGEWYSDEESLLQLVRDWCSESEPEPPLQPLHVPPLVTLGCAIWWHVDFSTPEGRMWGWDPNARCEQHRFFVEQFTLAEWLADWLEGNRTFPQPPPVVDCPSC
ncbi:SMI1/KNR4 family protein [Streptomyces tuirus]|uniref:SMI1/KNR4 family protein n=1 Tax=Streptomyces tuirus TaxID=68278 RepID=UPI00341CD056